MFIDCVSVKNITKNAMPMLYTEEGRYDGVFSRTGCLYSIALEEGNTYHIDTSDYKSGNLRIEFYLYINPNEVYIDIPYYIRDNNENMFICYDEKAMKKITNQLRETHLIPEADIFNIKQQYLTKSKQHQNRVKISNDILIILSNDSKEVKANQLVPFLYIKIENTTSFDEFIRSIKQLKYKIQRNLSDIFGTVDANFSHKISDIEIRYTCS